MSTDVKDALQTAQDSWDRLSAHLKTFRVAINSHDRVVQEYARLLATAALESYLDSMMAADLILKQEAKL